MNSSCLVLFGKHKIFSVPEFATFLNPSCFFLKYRSVHCSINIKKFGAPSSFFNFFFSEKVERPGLVGIDRTTGKPVRQELPEGQEWLLRQCISATMFPSWISDVGWICRVYKSQIIFHRFCVFVRSANTNGAGWFRALFKLYEHVFLCFLHSHWL